MQCAMYVFLMLLLTACVSRSGHFSQCGIWAGITLRETLGYVDITCVMSVSKSPLPFIVPYYFFWLKIGNNILITCGLLHVLYMNKQGVLFIANLFGYLHSCTHISSDISLCYSGSHYKSSTLVGFMYPVIALHVWLSSGSSRCACLDLDHTVPHLEFASFLRKLFRVEPALSLFSICLIVTKCPVLGYT